MENIDKDPYNLGHSLSIKELVKLLRDLSEQYYNTGEPVVSDEIYDILYGILEERDPKNKFLMETGVKYDKEMVKLPYFMPKLNKIKSDMQAMNKWLSKYSGPFVISEKLDGISALLYVETNGLIKLYSRGNGQKGQDISALISYVLPLTVKRSVLPMGLAVRGELCITKDNFDLVRGDYKNARNAVGGLVNCKTYTNRLDLAKVTQFVAHSCIYPELTIQDQLENLEKWGFEVVDHLVKPSFNYDDLNKYLEDRRQKSEFGTDGIVIVDGATIYPNSPSIPSFAFAFKSILTQQRAESIVVDVIWTTSRHGYIKPRVQIQPVIMDDVEINFATGFNAKYIVDNCIGPGAVIEIVRSGDVIPDIVKVLKPASEPKLPSIDYIWTDTHVDIIAIHEDDTQIAKRITHFFKTLDIKGLGEGTIRKFVDAGYKSLFDIIRAKDELSDIPGIGQKTINSLFQGLSEKLSHATISDIMTASMIFGRGFGKTLTSSIISTYPDILTSNLTYNQLIDKLCQIRGFSTKTATRFATHLDEFKSFYLELTSLISIPHSPKSSSSSPCSSDYNKFHNQIIVFSGFRNKLWEEYIKERGGSVKTSVSKKTTLLIFKDTTTSKYHDAQKFNVQTMPHDEFALLLTSPTHVITN